MTESVAILSETDLPEEKISVVISTFDGPLDCLVWAVTSLFLNSDGLVDDVIVSINGGDTRNGGDVSLQDAKQKFCEDMADLGYPVTVARSWSRIGYSQPYDLAVPLAKNRCYVLMHDDAMIRNTDWVGPAREFLNDPEAGMMVHHPLKKFPMTYYGQKELHMTAFNTFFVLANSKKIKRRWQDYYINREYVPRDIIDVDVMNKYQASMGNLAYDRPVPGGVNFEGHDDTNGRPQARSSFRDGVSDKEYFQILEPDYPIAITQYHTGTWNFYDAQNAGNIRYFPKDCVYHWMQREVTPCHECIDLKKLERRIKQNETLWELYVKYCPHKKDVSLDWYPRECFVDTPQEPDPKYGKKIVVCVGVYDRIWSMKFWTKLWPKMNKCNARLVLMHNYNGSAPDPRLLKYHMALKPDYYVPRPNVGFGSGMLHDIVESRNLDDLKVPLDWDVLFWFTDDNIPADLDLIPMTMDKLMEPDVMLVGHVVNSYNMRTTSFALRKEAVEHLVFHGSPLVPRRQGDYLEHEHDSITTQIMNAGFKVGNCNPDPRLFVYDPTRMSNAFNDERLLEMAGEWFPIPEQTDIPERIE